MTFEQAVAATREFSPYGYILLRYEYGDALVRPASISCYIWAENISAYGASWEACLAQLADGLRPCNDLSGAPTTDVGPGTDQDEKEKG